MSEEKEIIQQAVENTPQAVTLATHGFALALGMLGGLVRFLRNKVGNGTSWWKDPRSWVDFLIEGLTSAFVGYLVLMLCEWQGVDRYLAGALAGLAGLESGRAIELLIRFAERKTGVNNDANNA